MPQFKVAVYLYPKADLLDFSGPVEIYSYYPYEGSTEQPFSVTSFAHHNPVTSGSSALVYVPNATFADVSERIEDFDILVIPGAHFDTIADLINAEEGKELCQLIQKFTQSKPRSETGKRILQSVCTGSVLIAASGVLAGRTITTHHMGLDMLKRVADDAAGGDSKVNVVRQRWVDAGTTEAGVRIVNAGGVSSGIDATIWIVEQLHGKAAADQVADIAEFERRDAAWGVST
ncbi:Transcriptional regulator containing an amidase domain and an AraC-type DNA-binding HTH domain [Pyrenophora tritici-repentis]|uniref:Transcriptional regulator n=2 Tax=Pyrenophora tritici-repentis TaxID=45151 RepID=A0A2W1DVE3_9PLEO|nr:transcriptional regulator [Pyrenophora tritici-repentis Pt-1C-BFP]KAA8624977.1 transcriptional regulator [Pyrenophora tritici-repentis]EDU39815.1 transcriptional regulator [Pyrenophora tritici-repentis Pt-1C-BFP]KAF7453370.1 transcriptional regulator [Pyrenophora tritici-repentis]KAF7576434.1 Transcriptional regulator protein [Pyrenophora tritici-repentis]KAG9387122.1 transcriptional regulator [Pyrenophora tritici-repentis]